jgi:uncharacterized protein (TIGR02266 family)
VSDHRRTDRAPVQIWVRNVGQNELSLWFDEDTVAGDFTFCYSTLDISEGGLFLETDAPLTVNDELELELTLPGGSRHKVKAAVKWVRDPEDAVEKAMRSGMGLQFVDPTPELQEAIRNFLAV